MDDGLSRNRSVRGFGYHTSKLMIRHRCVVLLACSGTDGGVCKCIGEYCGASGTCGDTGHRLLLLACQWGTSVSIGPSSRVFMCL